MPYPSITFPYTLNPGDSLRFRVIITYITESINGYAIDSLHYASEIDTGRIIIMLNDTLVYSSVRDHQDEEAPVVNVFPNPSSKTATLSFSLHDTERVRLEIFDLNGRKVRSLADEFLQPGIHAIKWDLLSDTRTRVVNGIYFYKLTTDKVALTGRIIVY